MNDTVTAADTPTTEDFTARLRQDGFAEVATRSLPPGQVVPLHSHPFEVRALVVDGEITLTVDASRRTYRAGDVFQMARACEHVEHVGDAGVTYVVGRKH